MNLIQGDIDLSCILVRLNPKSREKLAGRHTHTHIYVFVCAVEDHRVVYILGDFEYWKVELATFLSQPPTAINFETTDQVDGINSTLIYNFPNLV